MSARAATIIPVSELTGQVSAMSSTNCHNCGKQLATYHAACPHCGAAQDAASRAESARKGREVLIAISPAVLGALVGWAASGDAWAIFGGAGAGLVVGVGIIAALDVRRGGL